MVQEGQVSCRNPEEAGHLSDGGVPFVACTHTFNCVFLFTPKPVRLSLCYKKSYRQTDRQTDDSEYCVLLMIGGHGIFTQAA